MNYLISVKCKETFKHTLHHPHFLCPEPDQSTGPSSFWNFPHSHRSKVPMPICRTSHTHLTERTRVESSAAPELTASPPPPSHPPPSLPGIQSRREPQELSREPHVQKYGQRIPDKSEQDQSWAFISDLQGKVLPGEPHANPLVQGRGVDRARGRVGGSAFSKVK